MSAMEKLSKAFETLKLVQSSSDDSSSRAKEKVNLCVLVADMICIPETRSAHNFQLLLTVSMDTLLKMCDDPDSNVRMIADECLNRIIRVQIDNMNVSKIHVELHKVIKKNENAKSLRAALWRFGELANFIRPLKGKPYMQNLVPCLIGVAERKEESVIETLATAMPKIMSALGCFLTDNEAKQLLHVFMKNIHNENPVFRRTAANSILAICLHCPKSQVFVVHTITTLLELVLPVKEDLSTYTILGVLNSVRVLLPHLDSKSKESFLRGSFGVKRKSNIPITLSVDSMIQIYELCLHWTYHCDHNVVTSALETLHELLTCSPPKLASILIDSQGLGRSRINSALNRKITSRTLSELSVVAAIPPADDSQLIDNEDVILGPKITDWLSNPAQKSDSSSSNPTLDSSSDVPDTDSVINEEIQEILLSQEHPESPEPDVFLSRDTPSPPIHQHVMSWDIGTATETNSSPLLFCARRLVSGFLVPECTTARVSVRTLAINCLTQVLRLYPRLFFFELDKEGQKTPQGFSHISDVLCFSTHSDPQLRGLVRILIGHLINSQYNHGCSSSEQWLSLNNKLITMDKLTQIIMEGLEDESTVCVRHSLTGLSICLTNIIEFKDFPHAEPILEKLFVLVKNSYWLIKAKFIELACSLPYQCIYYITGNDSFQKTIIESVLPVLLSNEDSRVRKATAEGILALVANLYFCDVHEHDCAVIGRTSTLCSSVFTSIYELKKEKYEFSQRLSIENNLSRLVYILVQRLVNCSSKYLSYGCIESLMLLSEKYSPSEYPVSWQCLLLNRAESSSPSGFFNFLVSLLTNSPLALDLEFHQWLLTLTGNVLLGLSQNSSLSPSGSDPLLSASSESLLIHLMRILAIFVRVMQDGARSRSSGPSPRRKVTRAPSPKKTDKHTLGGIIEEEKNHVELGQFSDIPHYLKLHDMIKAGYTNYKLTLDRGASEKFMNLISHTLKCLEQFLTHLDSTSSFSATEELLQYLRVTFILDSTATIRVVNQLIKSVFELNSKVKPSGHKAEFYSATGTHSKILLRPLDELSDHLEMNVELENKENCKNNAPEKDPHAPARDLTVLAARIKLLEGIVIQSLQVYTTTNNIRIQVEVLALLTHLVQLRMNYCLLDSDFIFIKFVKSQFQFIEAGQIHEAELLIPQIFKFLVHLSDEKNHSKCVISIPEIIQLCDGLMASGQNPVTHCIPALLPVVEHVFLSNVSNIDVNELETQREVMLAMLVRLAEYPQVLDILLKLMKEGWRWEDHWKRWYKQTVDSIHPLLVEGKLLVNDLKALHSMLSLSKDLCTPLNNVLVLLFSHQLENQTTSQWLCMITSMMLSVCTYDEESVLLQLEQMNLYVREEGDDPLNVNTVSKTLPPQHLLAKQLVRIVRTSITTLKTLVKTNANPQDIIELEKALANVLVCSSFMFDRRNYNKVAKSLTSLLLSTDDDLRDLNNCFTQVAFRCPILTLLWAKLCSILDLSNKSFWSCLISPVKLQKNMLNLQVVKRESIMYFCSYLVKHPDDIDGLKWLLDEHIEDIIWYCQEAPVDKLLTCIYNLEKNSEILLDAVSKCNLIPKPVFIHRLLQTVENIHCNYTGKILILITRTLVDLKNIAVGRLAATFCCRTVEYMLTLDEPTVQKMLSKEELYGILQSLESNKKKCRRYSSLLSLLKKLGEQVYGVTVWDSGDQQSINAEEIRTLVLNKSWLLSQIIQKCKRESDPDGVQSARLLSKLEENELLTVLSCEEFDKYILQHCFPLGTQLTVQLNAGKSVTLYEKLFPLYECARSVILKSIAHLSDSLTSQIVNPDKCYAEELNSLIEKLNIKDNLLPIVMGASSYLSSFTDLLRINDNIDNLLPKQYHRSVVNLSVICVQSAIHIYESSNSSGLSRCSVILSLFECSALIFQHDALLSLLNLDQIFIICVNIFKLYKHLTGKEIPLKELKTDCDTDKSERQQLMLKMGILMGSLICWVENDASSYLPSALNGAFRSIIVSLGRVQSVNWLCRIPFEAWQYPLSGDTPPSIPLFLLHDTDVLQQIVSRIRTLGWIGRHQFEETWVLLLSAISPNPDIDNIDQEEVSAIMEANRLAIDGITWLILSTLSIKNSGSESCRILHVPRVGVHKLHQLNYWKRLEEMNEILCWKMKRLEVRGKLNLMQIDKRPNLERPNHSYSYYGYGQLSVSCLEAQITPTDEGSNDYNEDSIIENTLPVNSIDIRSCVQLVLDLFGQWVLPNSGITINLLQSMVKSILCLSDMFTERTHYEWMLNTFLEMSRSHPHQDEIMLQYLVVGVAKATAVLKALDGDNSDKVLKIIESALKNSFAPVRSAAIHGLLYLLQMTKKLNSDSEIPKQQVQEFRLKLLQLVDDFIHETLADGSSKHLEDFELIISLCVFLLESYPEDIHDTESIVKNMLMLAKNPPNNYIFQTIVQGFERLVLIGPKEYKEPITRLALERFSQSDPCLSLPSLQLLIACIYSEKSDSKDANGENDDAVWTMEIMEKTSALFDKIKKGYPVEVEIICEILPGILSDFFPVLDVSTKVISEFLSPNQPHKKNMAAMVFQVFSQACTEKQLHLLQEWVVDSLINITHNSPVVTAVWSLCCFFISASANPWLRAIFPHVQSRIRQCEYEDRKILCIAATQFYRQLNAKQQEIFLKSFKEAASSQKDVFSDIISCL